MSQDDAAPLDGNAAAGALSTVFAFDVTSSVGRCAGCGRTSAMGGARVYAAGPGLVVRCPGCDAVLVRVVESEGRTWVDVRGLAYLEVATG